MVDTVYLDNAATTQPDPRVVAASASWGAGFGNPSSMHATGRIARAAVDRARAQVAELIGASKDEIVFTASGTEADNLAIRGVLGSMRDGRGHLVVSAIEHPAVLETAYYLQQCGLELTLVPPLENGIVDPDDVAAAIRPDTRLVSVMSANNVTGTIQPISRLAKIARERGVPFHTDAVQAAGKMPLDVKRDGIDLMSLSAHKFHGPQGVGALFVGSDLNIAPLILGGGQERGLRSATENVAGIVGFGAAAEIARAEMSSEACRLVAMRDRAIETVLGSVSGAYLIGDRYRRLPGHICLGFSGLEGEAIKLLLALDQMSIEVSSGSACSVHHAGSPSHVLTAMGFDPISARGSLRVTFGRFTTNDDVDRLLAALPVAVSSLRPLNSSR